MERRWFGHRLRLVLRLGLRLRLGLGLGLRQCLYLMHPILPHFCCSIVTHLPIKLRLGLELRLGLGLRLRHGCGLGEAATHI